MVRIFLVRHGEAAKAWGEADDPGLSERGRAQARATAEIIAGLQGVTLVSSPLRRCRDTAAPAARLMRQHCSVDPTVAEVRTPPSTSFGIADRRAWLRRNFAWGSEAAPVAWAALEPETRAWRDAALATAQAWRGDVVVFTHFVLINALAGASLKREDTVVCRPDFASVTELVRENGELKLVRLGAQMQAGPMPSGEVR